MTHTFTRAADQRLHVEDVIRGYPMRPRVAQADQQRAEARQEFEIEGVPEPQEGRQLVGYPVVFNSWTQINSWDGPFLERVLPGAADRTLEARADQIQLMFNHGFDFMLEQTPIGRYSRFNTEDTGVWAEATLADRGTYDKLDLVVELIRMGAIWGQSFRFSVLEEVWRDEPGRSEHNPDGLPERDIVAFRWYESGPVTYPAYEATTVSLRDGEPVAVRSREEWALWSRGRDLPTLEQVVDQERSKRSPSRARVVRQGQLEELSRRVSALSA